MSIHHWLFNLFFSKNHNVDIFECHGYLEYTSDTYILDKGVNYSFVWINLPIIPPRAGIAWMLRVFLLINVTMREAISDVFPF